MANPTQIQLRRDTTANWQLSNTVLALGEVGVDLTLQRMKVGNGAAPWQSLPHVDGKPPVGSVIMSRFGRAVASGAAKLSTQNLWRLPADIVAFRIGHESNETAAITVSLAKYAIVGTGASDTPTAAVDAAANFPSGSPTAITFNGAGALTIPAHLATDVPGPVVWSDWMFVNAVAGQSLAVRELYSASTTYPYAGVGFSPYSDLLAATAYPVANWTDTTDRVTANNAWAITSANASGNMSITHVEFMTKAAAVINICEVGDSTTVGTVDTGTQALPSIWAACESLSNASVLLRPIARGWGGKEEKQYYTYLLQQMADQKPHILIWQVWSQNDFSADLATVQPLVLDVIRRLKDARVVPVLDLAIPANTLGSAADTLRKSLNSWCKTLGVICIDRDSVISDGATPARYQAKYGAGTHPNLLGYSDMLANAYLPSIRMAVGQCGFTV